MNDLISVIVPVYNVDVYLPECINSLMNQEYTNLEIILVDDGSTDDSGKICDEYQKKDERIKVIHKNNAGVSEARNTGIEESSGEYIAFVDSDDYVDNDYIYVLYKTLLKDNSDLSVCNFTKLTKKKSNLDKNYKYYCVDAETAIDNMFEGNSIQGYIWCKLFKKNIIRKIKFDSNIKVCEDLLFVVEYLKCSTKVSCTSSKLYYYRQRKNSALNKVSDAKLTVFIALNILYNHYCNNVKFKNLYFSFYAKYSRYLNKDLIRYDFKNIYLHNDLSVKNKLLYFIYKFFSKKLISYCILLKQKIYHFYE